MDVNCLQKELEISAGEVWTLSEKEMGWFAEGEFFLPERVLRRFQNLRGLVRKSDLERVFCHCCWENLLEREDISSLRIGILGLEGSFALRISRSWIRGLTAGGREGSKSLMKPAGTECLEAVRRIFRKRASSLGQEVGGGRFSKRRSVSSWKEGQFALG
jgi:hypothetical protein